MSSLDIAVANYKALAANPYPGRGIVAGIDPDGRGIIATWIMGRSENSRNRIYSYNGQGRVSTEPADPSKVQDPSLIIYTAMDQRDDLFVASNGSQTDNVINNGGMQTLHDVLIEEDFSYEPDAPNFTPRITVAMNLTDVSFLEFEILKKSRWSDFCDRHSFIYEMVERGFGLCITTYMGDGNPLPAFCGEPYPIPLPYTGAKAIAEYLWSALNAQNRISIAVKEINLETHESEVTILNRFSKVEAQAS